MEQRQDPYSFRRLKQLPPPKEDGRDFGMVPAALRGGKLTPEEVAKAVSHRPAKPPGKS